MPVPATTTIPVPAPTPTVVPKAVETTDVERRLEGLERECAKLRVSLARRTAVGGIALVVTTLLVLGMETLRAHRISPPQDLAPAFKLPRDLVADSLTITDPMGRARVTIGSERGARFEDKTPFGVFVVGPGKEKVSIATSTSFASVSLQDVAGKRRADLFAGPMSSDLSFLDGEGYTRVRLGTTHEDTPWLLLGGSNIRPGLQIGVSSDREKDWVSFKVWAKDKHAHDLLDDEGIPIR